MGSVAECLHRVMFVAVCSGQFTLGSVAECLYWMVFVTVYSGRWL